MQILWDDAVQNGAQLFSQEAMEELSALHCVPKRVSAKRYLKAKRAIREWMRDTKRQDEKTRKLTEAERWILDNHHFLNQVMDAIAQQGDLGQLPTYPSGRYAGLARIQAILLSMIAQKNAQIDQEDILQAILQVQKDRELEMAELYAIETVLRMELIGVVGKIAGICLANVKQQRIAEHTVRSIEKGRDIGWLCRRQPHTDAYLERLAQELRRGDPQQMQRLQKTVLGQNQEPLDEAVNRYHMHCAEYASVISNAITSLNRLMGVDFLEIFQKTSRVQQYLEKDGVYAQMDADSQFHYLMEVAKLAKCAGRKESDIAKAIVSLARGREGIAGHVGFYLLAEGKREIQALFGLKAHGLTRRLRGMLYFGGILLVSAALTAAVVWYAVFRYGDFLEALACAVFGFMIFFGIIQQVANAIVAKAVKPAFLPKMGYRHLPAECKTAVCMPVVAVSEKDIEERLFALEAHYHNFREKSAQFILLCDLPAAQSRTEETDQKILDAGIYKIQQLNKTYGDRFSLLVRKRVLMRGEAQWMGYDRKRGAIEEMNRLILYGEPGNIICYGAKLERGIRYVLTLDADTRLCPGDALRLVNTISHPLNRYWGYSIIQPRVVTSARSLAESRMARIFGAPGMDFYNARTSEAYMDLFSEGIYVGKGIYDVLAFARAVDGKIPSGRILSHDLLEGCLAKVGYASDIQFIDSFPGKYSSWAKREHRWIRGDWQLIPYLFGRMKDAQGEKIRLTFLDRWKMADNLRRSFLPIAATQIFALGATFSKGSYLVYALVAFCPYWFPVFFSLLQGIVTFFSRGFRHGVAAWRGCKRTAIRSATSFFLCAYDGDVAFDAIVKTIGRLISKQDLLQWMTASEAERGTPITLAGYFRMMVPALIFNIAVVVVTALFATPRLPFTLAVCILWGFSPAFAYLLDLGERKPSMDDEERGYLRDIAQQTWMYYKTFASKEYHMLAPDNVQIAPKREAAARTSPTNMGFTLLAAVCARKMDLISEEEMLDRLEGGIASIERLEKWKGHCYNWYDLKTLQPLNPKYVSSVDSGNLAASLLLCAQAMLLLSEQGNSKTKALSNRARRLVKEMDFSELYDEKRNLFFIGYDALKEARSSAYYDLYASEARLMSLCAVAKGDVPEEHMKKLARPLTSYGLKNAMLSWSGTMFEYLMPMLFYQPFLGTVEYRMGQGALDLQMEYAKQHQIPWGISESGYFAFDLQGYYQYHAFGVPRLSVRSLKRQERVVAPYASLMAAIFRPKSAVENLRNLERMGARGRYGFYEAMDFSGAKRGAVVRSFMAHHQGMAFCGIVNALEDHFLTKAFASDPMIYAALPLVEQQASDLPARRMEVEYYKEKKNRQHSASAAQQPGQAPQAAVFSGAGYSMYITQNGTGSAMVDGKCVYRDQRDPNLEDGGVRIYIRPEGQSPISPCYLPLMPQGTFQARFEPHRAVYSAKRDQLSTQMVCCVAPNTGTELRLITVENSAQKPMEVEILAALEPVLAKKEDDDNHPAFMNLFLQTQARDDILLCGRRDRETGQVQEQLYFAMYTDKPSEVQYDTDKETFLGRCHGYARPNGLSSPLTQKTGAMIHPILAQKRKLTIPPNRKIHAVVAIGVAADPQEALRIAKGYQNVGLVKRVQEAAGAYANAQAEYYALSAKEVLACFDTATRLLYHGPQCRKKGGRGQLFSCGVSGNDPVALVQVAEQSDLPLLQRALKQHAYLLQRGLAHDLIVLDCCQTGYQDGVREEMERELSVYTNAPNHRIVIKSNAQGDDGLEEAVDYIYGHEEQPQTPPAPRKLNQAKKGKEIGVSDLEYDNGLGGFQKDGKEYCIHLKDNQTPMPWCNIMANPKFGCLLSERGAGYDWYENAREFKLTPWSNEPIQNKHYQALYVRDEKDQSVCCPMGGPIQPAQIQVNHGFGYTDFFCEQGELRMETTVFVDREHPVKVIALTLHNIARQKRSLSATYLVNWVLSQQNAPQIGRIVQRYDPATGAILAQNRYELQNADHIGFLFAQGGEAEYELLRDEIYGCCAKPSAPLCMTREHLGCEEYEANSAACALRIHVEMEPGQKRTCYFVLGACKEGQEGEILSHFRTEQQIRQAKKDAIAAWRQRLERIQIHTPDRKMDLLINGFLPYQVYSARFFGRTGFYQAGGAFGFRDQLQDALSMLDREPELVHQQILRCAAHQFPDGDVQHWWHEPARGVRTKITDDLLFLPYAVRLYLDRTTQDFILEEQAPYLEQREIPPGKDDIYYEAANQGEGSIYEHCIAALNRVCRFGEHGLPLMGTGDWNDGMSRVGREGKGESVWLGWFLYNVLEQFIPIMEKKRDTKNVLRYRSIQPELKKALDAAFEGDRYRRAYLDNGLALGSKESEEGKIDLICQAWAVLSGGADPEKARVGMQTAKSLLVDEQAGIIRLLWPPFDSWEEADVGYIKGYLPGIRENGGQYTHGAVWFLCALCQMGEADQAVRLFDMISPIQHAQTLQGAECYRAEPYVVSADIYSVPPNTGRAGWSWYTGSAGWMIRLVLQWILGFRIKGEEVTLHPNIPNSWEGFEIVYRPESGGEKRFSYQNPSYEKNAPK